MSVSLSKGSHVSLAKEASNIGLKLDKINIGLGWDSREDMRCDLDAWALAVTEAGLKRGNLVYYCNLRDESGYINHFGDNVTGVGDGDDEIISINLNKLPKDYKYVIIGVTIFNARNRRQSFKYINNAFIRLFDDKTGVEICKYKDDKFKNEFGDDTSLLFGVFSKVNGEWEFNAVGNGSNMEKITAALDIYSADTVSDILSKLQNNNNGGKKTMAVSLSKGGKVSLAKVAADAGIQGGLSKVIVGLGWDTNRYDGGEKFDLDAAAFMLGANGKVRTDSDFIFYNNKNGQGVTHTGDNRTGEGEGDDEQIIVELNQVPADVNKISFTVTIDEADKRNQSFGSVENAYARLVDATTGTELVRCDLTEDFSVETAIVVVELYRHNGEWKFGAVESGFAGGLAALCRNFGVDIG